MCGIAGVRKYTDDAPILGEEIILLLCSLEHRGRDATGIALVNPDGIVVHKAPVPAWQYTKTKDFLEFLEHNLTERTKMALLHTRAATLGNPEENVNNHPMFDGETAIVHNGMIRNHFELFREGKYHRVAECDSDIVRATVHEHGLREKGIRELSKMQGSAAIACVSTRWPGELLLARSGSPLVLGFTKDEKKMYWASEAQAIQKACRPFRQVRNVWVQDTKVDISLLSMRDNTAYVFGQEVMELHHNFPVCSSYTAPNYDRNRRTYAARHRAWLEELRIKSRPTIAGVVETPVEKGTIMVCEGCGTPNRNLNGYSWHFLKCNSCNKWMEERKVN